MSIFKEALHDIRRRHYRTAEDAGDETNDICGECANDWPCQTVEMIDKALDTHLAPNDAHDPLCDLYEPCSEDDAAHTPKDGVPGHTCAVCGNFCDCRYVALIREDERQRVAAARKDGSHE